MRQLLVAVISGLLTSVLGGWVLSRWVDRWSEFPAWAQVLLVGALFLLGALLVYACLARRGGAEAVRVASDLRGRDGVSVEDVEVSDSNSSVGAVASNLKATEGRVEVRHVTYKRPGGSGDDRRSGD